MWEQTNNKVLFYSYVYKITQNRLLCATKSQVPASLLLWFKLAHSLKVTFSHTQKQAQKACKYYINVLQNASKGKKRIFKITPPVQKMHYKTLSILIGNIPDFVAPKPSFYWPFTCSIPYPFCTLIGAMRRGYWAQEEKVVEARKKPKKRAEEAGLEPHPISQERQDNTDHTSFTSKWNTQKGLLQIATEQDKGGTERYFRSILKQIRCI